MSSGLRGSGFTLTRVQDGNTDVAARKTKIICTVGPACWATEMLVQLIDCGMGVARLNFSHGDHEGHEAAIGRLRQARAQREHCHVAVMLDTKGPEIRTGFFAEGTKKVEYAKGTEVRIVADYSTKGDAHTIACSYAGLAKVVTVGSAILVADGALVLRVKEACADGSVLAVAENTASLGERKNMNLPGAVTDLPTLTEKDSEDITYFAGRGLIDLIAASFVRKASDVVQIKQLLATVGAQQVGVIAKIENQEGMENFDEILEVCDGVMVARGDLGMEIPPEKVFLAQKMMIRKANIAGKPVVTATQMLDSMISNPRPTRAECADVANAVLDGTDCVMLSGETAGGEYPREAVTIMARTCCEAEASLNYDGVLQATRTSTALKLSPAPFSPLESLAASAVRIGTDVNAGAIVVLSESGTSARLLAKYRPSMPVLTITHDEHTARVVQGIMRGMHARCVGEAGLVRNAEMLVELGAQACVDEGWCQPGDLIVVLRGTDLSKVKASLPVGNVSVERVRGARM